MPTLDKPNSLGKKNGRIVRFLLDLQVQPVAIFDGSIGLSSVDGDSLNSDSAELEDGGLREYGWA